MFFVAWNCISYDEAIKIINELDISITLDVCEHSSDSIIATNDLEPYESCELFVPGNTPDKECDWHEICYLETGDKEKWISHVKNNKWDGISPRVRLMLEKHDHKTSN